MITKDHLPAEYKPYQNIDFCSNHLHGGGHIFAMGQVIPLLVGTGEHPRIWLQAVSTPGKQNFVTIVSDSKPNHPAVSVETKGAKVIVSVQGRTVLCVESCGPDTASVTELDLRPIGLNIFGNSSSLSLGNMQLSQNTFAGVGVAFGLGA